MRIQFAIDSERFAGELYRNPVAQDLAAQLPLTLTFRDFNAVEKVARLEHPVRLSGVPAADAPAPGEVGYYAPSQGLVLYYGHVGRWPGLVRVGRFTWDLEKLRALPDGFTAHITRLEDGG